MGRETLSWEVQSHRMVGWITSDGMINLEEHLAADTDPLYRDLRAGGRGINNAGQIVAQAIGQAVLLTPFVLGCDDAVNACSRRRARPRTASIAG